VIVNICIIFRFYKSFGILEIIREADNKPPFRIIEDYEKALT